MLKSRTILSLKHWKKWEEVILPIILDVQSL